MCCHLFRNCGGSFPGRGTPREACPRPSHLLGFALPSTDPQSPCPRFPSQLSQTLSESPLQSLPSTLSLPLSTGQTSVLFQSRGWCPLPSPHPWACLRSSSPGPLPSSTSSPASELAGMAAGFPEDQTRQPKAGVHCALPAMLTPTWPVLTLLGPAHSPPSSGPWLLPGTNLKEPWSFTEVPSELSSLSPACPHGSPLPLTQVQH